MERGATGNRNAVFLDRDGVLTDNIWNPATGAYESPHALADLVLCANIYAPLHALQGAGYALFIVSNQPSYAKGKTTLEAIRAIAAAVEADLAAHGVTFAETYYCYHHPDGIIPEYSGACICRKPSPYFLHLAATRHGVDLQRSWMVGDRRSDIECGQRAGCSTVHIPPHDDPGTAIATPDYIAKNLATAAAIIVEQSKRRW